MSLIISFMLYTVTFLMYILSIVINTVFFVQLQNRKDFHFLLLIMFQIMLLI